MGHKIPIPCSFSSFSQSKKLNFQTTTISHLSLAIHGSYPASPSTATTFAAYLCTPKHLKARFWTELQSKTSSKPQTPAAYNSWTRSVFRRLERHYIQAILAVHTFIPIKPGWFHWLIWSRFLLRWTWECFRLKSFANAAKLPRLPDSSRCSRPLRSSPPRLWTRW